MRGEDQTAHRSGADRSVAQHRQTTSWLAGVSPSRLLQVWVWVVLLASCSPNQEPVVVTGMDSGEQELVDFLQQLVEAVRAKPDSGLRRGQLGMAYDTNGFHDAAETSYAQASRIDPNDFRWPYFRALTLATLGRLEEAVAAADLALSIDGGYLPALLSQGAWLLDLDLHDQAMTVYERALRLADDSATDAAARAGLARALMRQDRNQEAGLLLESLAGEYNHPYVRQLLSNVRRRLGQPVPDGIEEVRTLNWPDPRQNVKRNYLRGTIGKVLTAEKMLAQGKPEDAVELLAPLLLNVPDDRDILNNLGVAYRLTGDNEKAMELFNRGLIVDPEFHQFHFNLALIHEDQGDDLLALRHLRRTIELVPTLVQAQKHLFNILLRKEQYDGALEALEAVKLNGAANAGILFSAGLAAGALERWSQSVSHLRQSLRLDPTQGRGHLYLSRSLAHSGQFDEARASLDRAAAMGVGADDVRGARDYLDELEESGP